MTWNSIRQPLKYAVIPTLVMLFLALYPQLSYRVSGSANWHGSYFVSNYDEVAYSAYINSLINGSPRKYDPFLATPEQNESLYSIQFIPAYAIALPARMLGLSASSAFIFLIALLAIFSVLSIFWLLLEITGDGLLSSAGVLIVLCLGTAAAFQGELRYLLEGRILIDFLPFLRRYQPGISFPLFFIFCVLVWRSFTRINRKESFIYGILSGLIFAVLIFSYFYLWTAAAAWFICLVVTYLVFDKEKRMRILGIAATVGGIGLAALIPYFILLSERASNLDSVQLLSRTHAPVLFSPTLIIGVAVAVITVILSRRGIIKLSDPLALFTLSFALMPVVVFNQQLITGRSLQPVHYEIFIANYVVLVAITLLIAMTIRHNGVKAMRRGLIYLSIVAAGWGFFEVAASTSRNTIFAEIRDESIPAILRIQSEINESGTQTKAKAVHATNFITADFIPTVSTLRPLWNAHTSSAGGIDVIENKRLFYLYLYYSGYGENDLANALKISSFEVTAAIFGSERALPALGDTSNVITVAEMQSEVQKYSQFSKQFDKTTATDPVLSHIIVPAEAEPDMKNLDLWYKRDEGTVLGLFKVYKLELRP